MRLWLRVGIALGANTLSKVDWLSCIERLHEGSY